MKISDKIQEKMKNNENWYSFEYFPPKTEGGIENLLERIERMALSNPLWVDMTWYKNIFYLLGVLGVLLLILLYFYVPIFKTILTLTY
jgi:hypothetical protein